MKLTHSSIMSRNTHSGISMRSTNMTSSLTNSTTTSMLGFRLYICNIRFGIDISMTKDFEMHIDACFQHNFQDEMKNASFIEEQQKIFDVITTSNLRLFFIKGTHVVSKRHFSSNTSQTTTYIQQTPNSLN